MLLSSNTFRFTASLVAALSVSTSNSFAQAVPTPPKAAPRSGPIYHLQVHGAIDCAKVVADIRGSLDEAKRLDACLIVLELSGNESRPDLIWQSCIALRESALPMCAYLADSKDREVGTGQLTLALLTNTCFIAPETSIRTTPSPSLIDLAPTDTPWEVIAAETQDWVGRRLRSRGAASELAPLIVSPTTPAWLTHSGGRPAIVTQEPARTAVQAPPISSEPLPQQLVFERSGAMVLDLPHQTVQDLRLALPANSWMGAARRAGVHSASRVQRSHTSRLDSSLQRATSMLDASESKLIDIKDSLSLPLPPEASIAPSRYRQQGLLAARQCAAANEGLADLERLFADYPELLRRPVPGQTTTAGSPPAYAARWRSLVQSRRDRLARLESTSRQFQAVED